MQFLHFQGINNEFDMADLGHLKWALSTSMFNVRNIGPIYNGFGSLSSSFHVFYLSLMYNSVSCLLVMFLNRENPLKLYSSSSLLPHFSSFTVVVANGR